MKNQGQQNWQQLTAIQSGLIIGLSAIVVGYILVTKNGLMNAMVGISGGCLILLLLGLISVKLTLTKRLSTIQYAELYFGVKGNFICSLSMAIALFGFFIINLSLVSSAVTQLLNNIGVHFQLLYIVVNIAVGCLVTFLVVRGINVIGRFALISLPLVIFALIYGLLSIKQPHSPVALNDFHAFSFNGIALILASNLGIVIDMPTYYRFARSKRDAIATVCIIFLLVVPTISMVGIFLGLSKFDTVMIAALTKMGGTVANVIGISFLILTGCMINNGNIYSCYTAIEPFTSEHNKKTKLLLLGLSGTAFSCLKVISQLEHFIYAITICIGSMGAIIFTNFVLDKFEFKYDLINQNLNTLSIILASLFGMGSLIFAPFRLTGFAFLDASIIAIFVTLFFRTFIYARLLRKRH